MNDVVQNHGWTELTWIRMCTICFKISNVVTEFVCVSFTGEFIDVQSIRANEMWLYRSYDKYFLCLTILQAFYITLLAISASCRVPQYEKMFVAWYKSILCTSFRVSTCWTPGHACLGTKYYPDKHWQMNHTGDPKLRVNNATTTEQGSAKPCAYFLGCIMYQMPEPSWHLALSVSTIRKNIYRLDVQITFELYGNFRCLHVLYFK